MKIFTILVLISVIIWLSLPGCAGTPVITPITVTPAPVKQPEVTLIVGGYGYAVGDIVLMDTLKDPEIGDIVQYDARINKSDCMAFGPGVYLARIIALPGDNVSFQSSSYQVNGFVVDYSGPLRTMWGTEEFNKRSDISGRNLKVPENEFLADKWIGQECTGIVENGSSVAFGRYTIKRQAIKGILMEKTGHDKEFEERQKNIVY